MSVGAGSVGSAWSTYRGMINARLPVSSPVTMDLQIQFPKADSGTAHVQVVATDTIPFTDLRVRMAVIEHGLSSGGRNYNQMLRKYFPTHWGVPITIAEGDTANVSRDFPIRVAWVAENCWIVAFVQDNDTREVLQAIQKPVFTPVPDGIDDLTVVLAGDDLLLQWSPVVVDTNGNPIEVDLYHIYRDTVPFFSPGPASFDSTTEAFYLDNTGVVGDTSTHHYYAVTAVASGKESELSGQIGEFEILYPH